MNELDQVIKKLNILLDEENGLKLSGQGMIANNTKKMVEILDKIQRFSFFMEKRQTEMFDFMKEKFK